MRRSSGFPCWLIVASCVLGGIWECRPARSPVEERGGVLYEQMCAVCHGKTGEGYAADRAPAIGYPDFLAAVTDEFLRTAIRNGRAGTTMSAWGRERGGPLDREQVDALIAYVRSLRHAPAIELDEGVARGDARRGAALFSKECASCHGARGTGGEYVQVGDQELLRTATNGFLRDAIRAGRSGTPMDPFGAKLGKDGVEDLVTFLRSLEKMRDPLALPTPARPPPIPLGPVPLNPNGPEPVGFKVAPDTTPVEVVHAQLSRHARMALLDARAPPDYVNDHIAGAVSVPFYDPAPYLDALPKDAWLVCYCACPHAESGALAQKLLSHGFEKVTVLDEGIRVWASKGYETRSGTKP